MNSLTQHILALSSLMLVAVGSHSQAQAQTPPQPQEFSIIKDGQPAQICISANADKGVARAANSLANDIEGICGTRPAIVHTPSADQPQVVIGMLADNVLASMNVDAKQLQDSAEKHLMVVTPNRIVIAGADKRGTIYGIYALSKRLGVSPWTWWADVPLPQASNMALPVGTTTQGCPRVKYRGIFINDEWPSFGWWCNTHFGGINSKMYERMFELILRLNGNFMWPAMWASAFYDDDPANGPLANEMGIVMGTSHHEPMALAQQDWKRRGKGAWNYRTNQKNLDAFWQTGIERARNWETVVTVGMRGDGDEPMGESTEIALLSKIVKNQRKIIANVTGKKAEQTPQVWALYKEVQDYYDKGMKVPDDITLLLCDDNWGNVRRLPNLTDKPRRGGYGMYYHVDYVGDPRNYKWLNVSQVERIWEQMELCYSHGVRQLWVLNVGDLKPMEYPIQFFLDYAWNPDAIQTTDIKQHTVDFCALQFGSDRAERIADLLARYTKYNSRRTPEMLDADTYSLQNYNEWQRVVDEYRTLEADALREAYTLPAEMRDAYEQLILYPIVACANIYDMYYSVARNRALAAEGNVEANLWADRVQMLYERDSVYTHHYNQVMSAGKWSHMMDQTHIGYTYWQQPDVQVMPAVTRVPQNRMAVRTLFPEVDGHISIEAPNAQRQNGNWLFVENLGRTGSALTARKVDNNTWLEYDIETQTSTEPIIHIILSPTLNYGQEGHHLAVSIDGAQEQILDVHQLDAPRSQQGGVSITGSLDDNTWRSWVGNHAITLAVKMPNIKAGRHTIRLRPMNNAMVFQKIMVDLGGLKPSYLGAPPTPAATL